MTNLFSILWSFWTRSTAPGKATAPLCKTPNLKVPSLEIGFVLRFRGFLLLFFYFYLFLDVFGGRENLSSAPAQLNSIEILKSDGHFVLGM